MLDVQITDAAESDLSRLPRGLNERIRRRLEGIAVMVERTQWRTAFVGVRGARTLESVLDGFALRYSVDPISEAIVLTAVEDRRESAVRLGA